MTPPEMGIALRGSDFREGVASFMEKRPPRFTREVGEYVESGVSSPSSPSGYAARFAFLVVAAPRVARRASPPVVALRAMPGTLRLFVRGGATRSPKGEGGGARRIEPRTSPLRRRAFSQLSYGPDAAASV